MEKANLNQVTLKDWLVMMINSIKFLLSRKLVILISCFCFGVLGIVYAWLKDPIYTSQMTFALDSQKESGGLGAYAGIAAQFGIDLGSSGGGAFEGENFIEFLKSRLLIEQTLRKRYNENDAKLFIDYYLENHELNKDWNKKKNLSAIKFATNQESERLRDSVMNKVIDKILKNGLNVYRKDKKLNLVVIEMKDLNEVFSKRFIENLVDNGINYYTNYKSKKARANVEILERQVDSVRRILDGGIESVASSNDLNVNPIKQQARTSVQKKQIDIQTSGIIYGEALKNLALAKVVLQKETPLIQLIDKPVYPLKKEKPGRLLMGIIFTFIGFFITIFFLLIYRWIKETWNHQTQVS